MRKWTCAFAFAFVQLLLTAQTVFAVSPTIIRNSPSTTSHSINVGATVNFGIEATDSDGDLWAAEWFLGSSSLKWDPWSGRPKYYSTSQWSRTFSSSGTYYVTVYVYDDAGHQSSISWQINVIPPPSGTITASPTSCSIPAGASTCNVTLSWNVSNPVGTSEVTSNAPSSNTHIAYGNSGSQSVTVFRGGRTFFLINGTTLAQVTVGASCASGTTWNASAGICQYPPSGSISASPSSCSIAAGASTCSVNLSWSVSNAVGTSEVTSNTPSSNTHIAYGNSGSQSVTVFFGGRTFFLINGSTLDQVTVGANCTSGTNWNSSAGVCQAPPPSGTISASPSSCTISAGASSCNVNLSWSVSNAVGTSEVTSNTPTSGTHIAYGNSGSQSVPVFFGGRTFFLINGNTLDQVTVGASCASGSSWNANAGICQAPPSGSVSATPTSCSIAAGASSCNVTLSWSVSNAVGTSEVTSNTPTSGTHIAYGNSGSQSVAVFLGGRTFFLINGDTLDQVTVGASCVAGSSWNANAGVCQAVPTGTISASPTSCSIAAGASSCNVTLSWSVSNAVGTSEVTSNTPTSGMHIAYGNSGSQSVAVFFGGRTFFLINGDTLDQVTVGASCTAGSSWNANAGVCQAVPTGTISASPTSCSIAAGASSCNVTLAWSVTNPVGTSEVTSNTPTSGTHIAYGNSGSQSVSVFFGGRTFFLIDGDTLDQVTVSASCTTGTSWNANTGACQAAPSGTLTASPTSCSIAAGSSTCDVVLNWSVNNPIGTSAVTSNTPTSNYQIATGNSGSKSVPVYHGGRTFFLIDGIELARKTVAGACAAGSSWNAAGGVCQSTVTLSYDSPSCDAVPPALPAPAVRLHWTAISGATSYDVYRNGTAINPGMSSSTFAWTNSTGLSAGSTYSYFILANTASGSIQSNTVSAYIPANICASAAPGSLTLTAEQPICDTLEPSAPALRLNWTTSSLATSYTVYRDGFEYGVTNSTTFYDRNVSSGGLIHYYRVKARNGYGSADSNAVQVAVPPFVCGSCTGKDCDDANRCTSDTCDLSSGECQHQPIVNCCVSSGECVDSDPCSFDYCGPSATCLHEVISDCGQCESDDDCTGGEECEVAFCNGADLECQCVDTSLRATYVALGDSYSAGEGNPVFEDGTDTDGCQTGDDGEIQCSENRCHRSSVAYPNLFTLFGHQGVPVAVEAEGSASGEFHTFACSGAKIENVLAYGSGGKQQYSSEPPQLSAEIPPNTDAITITIGGNDAGFAPILQRCLSVPVPGSAGVTTLGPCEFGESATNAKIDSLSDRLYSLYGAIKAKVPGVPVFVLGYPQIVDTPACSDVGVTVGKLPLDPHYRMTDDAILYLRRVTIRMNEVVKNAASRAGVHFVDVIDTDSGAFAGHHELCGDSNEPWFTPPNAEHAEYSFHPTSRGQQAYADALHDFIRQKRVNGSENGFTPLGIPRNPNPIAPSAVTAVAESVTAASPEVSSLTAVPIASACSQGRSIRIGSSLNVRGEGYTSHEVVEIQLISAPDEPLLLLASVEVDDAGVLDSVVTIPASLTAAGPMFLIATGTSASSGQPLERIALIQVVPNSDADADGDGVTDSCDNCEEDPNDQADLDGDGVGDSCDACPSELANDIDGDGVCAPDDPCPLDPQDDEDGDGHCGDRDGCPTVYDPGQDDSDADGQNDACACVTGALCRASTGSCDAPEFCARGVCPDDSFASSSFACRGAAGVCDPVEYCTGSSSTCPADVLLSSATVCRTVAGPCDVIERCTGAQATCPADSVLPSTTTCRPSQGVCDIAEKCPGTTSACPADAVLPTSTTCRSSAGTCDIAEKCTGTSGSCPANAFVLSSIVCRGSSGTCDPAENCTGSTAGCPANTFASSSTVCRTGGGACDAAETCTGSSGTCPADALSASGTICRASDGPCDLAERCTGTQAGCPANVLATTATVCRPSLGNCDVAETCTGASMDCPVDTHQPNGTTCNDGNNCTQSDACSNGGCSGTASAGCVITINNVAELQNIERDRFGSYVLGRDIDASGYTFVPITWFQGVLDGKGHTIRNLRIDLPEQSQVGLMGSNYGTVKNLALTDVQFIGDLGVGGVASSNYGSITNVSVSGTLTGNQCVGGLACSNVSGPGIQRSYSSASVSCEFSAGGLVAQNSGGTIRDSFATGNVTAIQSAGGLVGSSSPNSGPSGGTIENVYATGSVTGNDYVGGLIGSVYLTEVSGAYATGAVVGTSNTGGLIGWAESSPVSAAYWDSQSTGRSTSAAGVARTTLQLQSGTLPSGFDQDVWSVAVGRYPVLSGVCRFGEPPVCDDTNSCTQDSCTEVGCLNVATPGLVCRASAGECDPAELCSGTPLTCPSDVLSASSTVCRAAAGICDVAERCRGTSPVCPSDVFQSSATSCRQSGGVCDVAEKCSGSAATCPADAFASVSVTCRTSGGSCDPSENCTGANAACPSNSFSSSSTVCRGAVGVCDAAETCTGNTAPCPSDSLSSSTVVCRPADGPCDIAERCAGNLVACPSNVLASSSAVCRSSAGICDVAEKCTGVAVSCPLDQWAPNDPVCRFSVGECDVAEHCANGVCPADSKRSNETPCTSDGDECTEDVCNGTGACVHQPNPQLPEPVVLYSLQPGPEGEDTDWGIELDQRGNPDSATMNFGGEKEPVYDYLRFNLDESPSAELITRAEIWLYATDEPAKDPKLDLHRVTEPWVESEVSISQHPASEYIGPVGELTLPGWNKLDITELYQDWKAQVAPNYGIELVPKFTQRSDGHFASSDNPDPTLRPKLVLWGTSTSCDDGDPCTVIDLCAGGLCAGTPIATCAVFCGDANDDGKVTATDALWALRSATGSQGCSLARCDYNGDGKVSASDALAILRTAVGAATEPKCEPVAS